MITIAPLAEFELTHRAYHLGIAASGYIAALSRDGSGSLIVPGSRSPISFQVPFEPTGVSLNADGTLLALSGEDRISILSASTLKPVNRFSDSFESCHFGANGMLWTCIRFDSETAVLDVWNPSDWTRVAKTEVTDPYGDSHFDLLPHPQPDGVVVWAAAGQDGQSLFWACLGNRAISVDPFPDLYDTTWPTFSPDEKDFLVISGGELHRYSYPRGPLLGTMEWPEHEKDDQMGDFVAYADAGHAILQSSNGRLLLIDTADMSVEDELSIRGHEPRPIAELYPSLKADRRFGSDLSMLFPLSKARLLSVHRELPGDPSESHDHLLIWQL